MGKEDIIRAQYIGVKVPKRGGSRDGIDEYSG